MKKTALHPLARPFFYWTITGFIFIQFLSCTSISRRNFAICSGVRCFFFSQGYKPLKNKDFLSSSSYSHSMKSNAFSLISVSPVRSRDSDSTDYLYSPCSTASVYQFFISVIKRLFCRGSRGIIPLESLYNISGLPSSKRDHLRRDFFGATIHDRQCFRGNVS